MTNLVCYCDGGYHRLLGNGYGSFRIYDENTDVTKRESYDIVTSSVDAEYQALISLLRFITENYPIDTSIIVYSDSKVMVNHLNSLWLVSAENILPYYQVAMTLFTRFTNRAIIWTPRKQIVIQLGH